MELQISVPSIMCDGCVETVTQAIQALDATATVQVDMATKLVTVKTQAAEPEIAQAITEAGHTIG